MRCFISNCLNGENTVKNIPEDNEEVYFFPAPQNTEMLEKWKKAIPKSKKLFSTGDFLCNLHFLNSDMVWYHETKLANGSLRRLPSDKPNIKPTTLPSLFDPPERKQTVQKRKLSIPEDAPKSKKKFTKSQKNAVQDSGASESSKDTKTRDVPFRNKMQPLIKLVPLESLVDNKGLGDSSKQGIKKKESCLISAVKKTRHDSSQKERNKILKEVSSPESGEEGMNNEVSERDELPSDNESGPVVEGVYSFNSDIIDIEEEEKPDITTIVIEDSDIEDKVNIEEERTDTIDDVEMELLKMHSPVKASSKTTHDDIENNLSNIHSSVEPVLENCDGVLSQNDSFKVKPSVPENVQVQTEGKTKTGMSIENSERRKSQEEVEAGIMERGEENSKEKDSSKVDRSEATSSVADEFENNRSEMHSSEEPVSENCGADEENSKEKNSSKVDKSEATSSVAEPEHQVINNTIFSQETITNILNQIRLPLTTPITFRIAPVVKSNEKSCEVSKISTPKRSKKTVPKSKVYAAPTPLPSISSLQKHTKELETDNTVEAFERLVQTRTAFDFCSFIENVEEGAQFKRLCCVLKSSLQDLADARYTRTSVGKLTIKISLDNKNNNKKLTEKNTSLDISAEVIEDLQRTVDSKV